MKNEIVKIDAPELMAIKESKAEQIKKTFEPMSKMLSEFEGSFNALVEEAKEEITQDLTEKAKRLRLDIGKVRIETGKLKDKQKEYIKLEDKAIMGVHNILVWAVKEKEDKLKEIEKYFEIQEQKRIEALQAERAERLSEFVEDAHERDLAKFANDEFEAFLSIKKKEKEDMIAAELKAEQDRIEAEAKAIEERKRMEEENKRLKKEAEERAAAEKVKEDAARKEREVLEAKIKKEQEAKAKIEAEIKAKEEAEEAARKKEEEDRQAELNKGDAAKVKDLVNDLQELKTKYSFKSAKNTKKYQDVGLLIDKVINHIEK